MPVAAQLTALVVDDQSSIRQLVRQGLLQIGFGEVRDAFDGEDGLKKIIEKPNSLVISDFNMPNLDGLAFLRAMRTYEPTRNTAFIMLTGRADRDLVARAVQFGVNNYLVKPFTVATLKEKIEAVFGTLT